MFQNIPCGDKTPEWHKYKSHGNYAEINIHHIGEML
jgi:hypothetical protein